MRFSAKSSYDRNPIGRAFASFLGTAIVIMTIVHSRETAASSQRESPSYAQERIKREYWSLAEPEPAVRPFAAINGNHKIMMALMDTGVDYNHPLLRDHIHFELDDQGQPIRENSRLAALGMDLTGNDSASSYRILAAEALDGTTRPSAEAGQRELNSCAALSVIDVDPRLRHYLDVNRDYSLEESSKADHGTHVGGLMVYDRPDFGIIPYRVLPQPASETVNAANGENKFIRGLERAFQHAAEHGVKIVNLSVFGWDEKDDEFPGLSRADKTERLAKLRPQMLQLEALIRSYSDRMLFVAAAGNERTWMDGQSRFGYPCGLNAPNILCVGALDEAGEIAKLTNIPLTESPVVFAYGTNVKSLKPTDSCTRLNDLMRTQFARGSQRKTIAGVSAIAFGLGGTGIQDETSQSLCKSIDPDGLHYLPDTDAIVAATPLIRSLWDECQDQSQMFSVKSGTSMATPFVAHALGELWAERVDQEPLEVLARLFAERTQEVRLGGGRLILPVLKAAEPSWNQAGQVLQSPQFQKVFYSETGSDLQR